MNASYLINASLSWQVCIKRPPSVKTTHKLETDVQYNQSRDGPLENLWGGRAKYKKKIRAREN